LSEQVNNFQRATECLKKAEHALDPDKKLALLSSAQSWLNLAVKEQRGANINARSAAKRRSSR
jgi:hypothetical protein